MPARITLALVVAAFALLPFSRLTEIPLALLSLVGIYMLLARKLDFSCRGFRYYNLAFLLFFVPMLLALPDAVNLEKSSITTFGSLRYYFAGLAIISLLGQRVGGLAKWMVAIMLVWTADALWQLATGSNILGYQYDGYRLNGMFGELGNFKLGLALVLFLPLTLIWGTERYSLWLAFGLSALLVAVIILSGNRSAWVMALLQLVVLAWYFLRSGRLRWPQLALGTGLLLLGSALVVFSNAGVRERTMDMVTAAKQRDYQSLDIALSQRLEIWQTAVAMFKDNWFNGVGPRGFRFAYGDYLQTPAEAPAPADAARPLAHHAHQLVLEVLAETGLIGLLFLLLLWGLLLHSWRTFKGDRILALAFAVPLLGLFFPINSHLAFYSSYSAQLMWLLLALYFSAQAKPLR